MMFEVLEHKTILVVDDDVQNRETVIDALFVLSPKTNVLSAIHGEQAYQIALQKKIDIILLDWEMPVLDGYNTLLKFKENEDLTGIPIIMYTGIMKSVDSLQKALMAGAADFLRKPTDPLEILARIRSILVQKQLFEQNLLAEKEKHHAQIEEMLTVTMNLQQMENLVEKIQEDLLEAIKLANPRENIQRILKELKKADLNENDWEKYKLRFDIAHQEFIERLSQKHPELSRQQLTVCSLLRLGLVTKEAAKVLDMSLEAIDKTRYRIRRKLAIPATITLESFLMTI